MGMMRIATLEDIATISRVLAASWKTAYRGTIHDDYLDTLSEEHWVDFLKNGIHDGNLSAMVFEETDIIGAAILNDAAEADAASLISFYILPDQIGHGIGHAFYTQIEHQLMVDGYSKCFLDVLENNKRAIRFYESHGFTDTKSIVKTTLGNCEYLCKIYEKNIHAY